MCPAILPLHCPPLPSPHRYWLIYPSASCLLICCTLVSESESCSSVSDSLRPHGLYSPRNSPSQDTGVGSLSLLQRIFSTQGSNPGLSHCRQILYQLSHKGSPKHLRNDLRVSRKDSDGAITPVSEAVHVPARLAPSGSPQAKQLHHLHAQRSLGRGCHRQKKKKVLHLCMQGRFGLV